MIELGYSSLFGSFLSFLLAVILFITGIKRKDLLFYESGKRAIFLGSSFIILSSLCLWYLLLISDFRVTYVANYTSKNLPFIYKFSAFWAGMDGSMLFWVLILSIYFLIYIFSAKSENLHRLISYTVISIVILFFTFITFFLTNPFRTLPFTPPDGRGLNPLLQNIWMLIHPVAIYFGFVGFTIPLSYAIAVFLKGERKDFSLEIRKWTLISWLFLSIGIVLGGRWAYVELGWGGYWAWDPVENASFLPWLTATAFVHTLFIQETKKMLKLWNLSLIIITFILVVTGTYITRSGALSSVHAFAESELGPYFGSFVLLNLFFLFFALFKYRGKLKDEGEKFSIFGLEGLILILLFSLIAITIITLIGTFYPIITGLILGQKMEVTPLFFVRATGPFFIIILILLAIYPFTYKNSSKFFFLISFLAFLLVSFFVFIKISKHPGAFLGYGVSAFALVSNIYRYIHDIKIGGLKLNEYFVRKTGSFFIHFGIVLSAIGIISSYGFKEEKEFVVKKGERVNFKNFEIEYIELSMASGQNYDEVRGDFLVKNSGRIKGKLSPALRFYHNWEQPSAEMDVLPLLNGDIYAVIQGWEEDETVYIQVFYNPLIQLVWFGTFLLFIGGVFVIITKRKK
ncbi:MAG: cytochrome c-type biogenesis CcmF C-terminal domain-containing protein [candidate division WOR-3 bacterium]